MPVVGESVRERLTVYLGIDPGASGGVAVVSGTGDAVAWPMPATERDVWDLIAPRKPEPAVGVFAVIERVHAMPKQGVSSTFKFGVGYGGLRMALVATGIPFDDVTPQRWQKALGVPPCGKTESKTQFKNRLKARAQQLFPELKITLATSDALLIAEFCRRLREGELVV